jgi:hypothetical protein
VFKGISLCLQASFVCCKYVLKYATKHLLGDNKNFLSNVFFQFFCCLRIIGKHLSFSIFLVSVHLCPTVLCAQNWLHVAEFLLIIKLWGTWVSGNFQWNVWGHLWWGEFVVYVSINMFNTAVCCYLNFTLQQRERIWSVISCAWLTGRERNIHAYAEIVLAILL